MDHHSEPMIICVKTYGVPFHHLHRTDRTGISLVPVAFSMAYWVC
jgi:hypothetical protein